MNFRAERWELGSEFHWPVPLEGERGWWPENAEYYGSGRDAMRALFEFGCDQLGWKRLWIPSYFCQEVVAALLTSGLETRLYPDVPTQPAPQLNGLGFRPGDLVLLTNYFGLRAQIDVSEIQQKGVVIVEDHTHDPWSNWAQNSSADYCLASLRKNLPLPDGGILWSATQRQLPKTPPTTAERELAAMKKLSGMLLKGLYLSGHEVDKAGFRELLGEGEEQVASGQISAMSRFSQQALKAFPVKTWQQKRRDNFAHFARAFTAKQGISLLQPGAVDLTPFSCVIKVDNPKKRDPLRAALIAQSVYPAVLWTLDEAAVEISSQDRELGRSLLSLHCDQRYEREDMERLASIVLEQYEMVSK